MIINRREFLKGLAAFAASISVSIPAFSDNRKPYVEIGEIVSFIGSAPGFIGNGKVLEILPFDKYGYPIILDMCGWYPSKQEIYFDTDLANFLKELPKNFWRIKGNKEKYLNVHQYVRIKRYGETPEEAEKQLNMYSYRKKNNLIKPLNLRPEKTK